MSHLDVTCVPWMPAFTVTNPERHDAIVTIIYQGGETVTRTLPAGESRRENVARAEVSAVWPHNGVQWPRNGEPRQVRCGLTSSTTAEQTTTTSATTVAPPTTEASTVPAPTTTFPPITSGPFDPTPATLPTTAIVTVPATLPFTDTSTTPIVAGSAVVALVVGAALIGLSGKRRRA